MSKRINLGNMTTDFVEGLSHFNQSLKAIDKINTEYREKISTAEKTLEDLRSDRKAYMDEEGHTLEEALVKFSTLDAENEIRALNTAKEKELEPWKETKKNAIKFFALKEVYTAYVSAMEKANFKPYTTIMQKFLEESGVETPETATSKMAQILALRASGVVRNGAKNRAKTGRLTRNKSEKQYVELFLMTFIDYCVIDKGVLDCDETGALTKHIFED